jgi:predicted RNase H-like HicB family nuclease
MRKPGRTFRAKVVIYENEGGGFTAEVPALRGCVAEGDTREELLHNLRDAIEGCLLAGSGDYQCLDETGKEEEVEL